VHAECRITDRGVFVIEVAARPIGGLLSDVLEADGGTRTASITGGSIGLPENVYTLDAPLYDATTAHTWSQEVRFSGGGEQFPWLAGLFFSHQDRDYGQDLPVIRPAFVRFPRRQTVNTAQTATQPDHHRPPPEDRNCNNRHWSATRR
jgi:hypothetical protein